MSYRSKDRWTLKILCSTNSDIFSSELPLKKFFHPLKIFRFLCKFYHKLPDIAAYIRGTYVDPFYDDKRIPEFLAFVQNFIDYD